MPPPRPLPVLVVDYYPDVASALAGYLRLRGYDAKPATQGQTALALAGDWHPAAAVVALRLSGMTGFELAARLCDLLPRHPLLVATTDLPTPAEWDRARLFGFDHYLVKPFEPEELVALLANHAEGLAD